MNGSFRCPERTRFASQLKIDFSERRKGFYYYVILSFISGHTCAHSSFEMFHFSLAEGAMIIYSLASELPYAYADGWR